MIIFFRIMIILTVVWRLSVYSFMISLPSSHRRFHKLLIIIFICVCSFIFVWSIFSWTIAIIFIILFLLMTIVISLIEFVYSLTIGLKIVFMKRHNGLFIYFIMKMLYNINLISWTKNFSSLFWLFWENEKHSFSFFFIFFIFLLSSAYFHYCIDCEIHLPFLFFIFIFHYFLHYYYLRYIKVYALNW